MCRLGPHHNRVKAVCFLLNSHAEAIVQVILNVMLIAVVLLFLSIDACRTRFKSVLLGGFDCTENCRCPRQKLIHDAQSAAMLKSSSKVFLHVALIAVILLFHTIKACKVLIILPLALELSAPAIIHSAARCSHDKGIFEVILNVVLIATILLLITIRPAEEVRKGLTRDSFSPYTKAGMARCSDILEVL